MVCLSPFGLSQNLFFASCHPAAAAGCFMGLRQTGWEMIYVPEFKIARLAAGGAFHTRWSVLSLYGGGGGGGNAVSSHLNTKINLSIKANGMHHCCVCMK